MELTLTVRSYCGQSVDQPNTRTFNAFPIIVGRSANCDYVLRDANMYISSNHAKISLEGTRLVLTDTSANGTYLNTPDNPVGKNKSITINSTDLLYIGDYCVLAEFHSSPHSSPYSSHRQDIDNTFDGIDNALRHTPPSSSQYNPFHDTDDEWLPDIDTPVKDEMLDLGGPDQQTSANNSEWTFEVQLNQPGSDSAESRDVANDDGWANLFEPDPQAPSGNADDRQQDGLLSSHSDDSLAWLPGTSDEVTLPGARTKHGGDFPDSFAQSPARAQPNDAVAYQSSSDNQGLSDFLHAAKVEAHLVPANDRSKLLYRAGRILNVMTEGIISLLHARKIMKDAMHGDVTQLGGANNNPLKFSHSASEALSKMLVSAAPGYKSPEHAIRESIDDLNLHQVAMLEAMKEAVRAMLLRFDPDGLASKLEKDRPITANIPVKREAELWNLFRAHYSEIRDEAVDDFGELFQREFRKAYQAHVARARNKTDY